MKPEITRFSNLVELANLFKTSTAQISRIINNKIWNTPEEL